MVGEGLAVAWCVELCMDYPTGVYPTVPRLPLLTLEEAREAVRLLRHFADETEEGRKAGEWAAEIGLRLPAGV